MKNINNFTYVNVVIIPDSPLDLHACSRIGREICKLPERHSSWQNDVFIQCLKCLSVRTVGGLNYLWRYKSNLCLISERNLHFSLRLLGGSRILLMLV